MKNKIVVDPNRPRAEVVSRAVRVLRGGGIVAFPTETFYGLAVDAMSEAACGRVFRVMGRELDKALPCILSSPAQLQIVTEKPSPVVLQLAERFWPGPLTLVIPARPEVAARAPNGTVAVRVSGLTIARELAGALGRPVTSTSANRAGGNPPETADEVVESFGLDVDLLLDGGPTRGGAPSTIIDTTCDPPALLRRGAIELTLVLEALAAARH